MGRRRKRPSPAAVFKHAVNNLRDLRWLPGLSAVKRGEGAGQIAGKDNRKVLGSVNIDDDCLKEHANASRWDYAIGYARNDATVAFFVEVHSAYTHEVGKMEKKLDWLLHLLNTPEGRPLLALNRDRKYYWVASGKNGIPKGTNQYKRLRTLSKKGLVGPLKCLELS